MIITLDIAWTVSLYFWTPLKGNVRINYFASTWTLLHSYYFASTVTKTDAITNTFTPTSSVTITVTTTITNAVTSPVTNSNTIPVNPPGLGNYICHGVVVRPSSNYPPQLWWQAWLGDSLLGSRSIWLKQFEKKTSRGWEFFFWLVDPSRNRLASTAYFAKPGFSVLVELF